MEHWRNRGVAVVSWLLLGIAAGIAFPPAPLAQVSIVPADAEVLFNDDFNAGTAKLNWNGHPNYDVLDGTVDLVSGGHFSTTSA